jgi:hypothetical protein
VPGVEHLPPQAREEPVQGWLAGFPLCTLMVGGRAPFQYDNSPQSLAAGTAEQLAVAVCAVASIVLLFTIGGREHARANCVASTEATQASQEKELVDSDSESEVAPLTLYTEWQQKQQQKMREASQRRRLWRRTITIRTSEILEAMMFEEEERERQRQAGVSQPVEAHGIARRRKCRQLGEVQLACTLSGLNPSQSRQVIVNIEHEQSGHKLLRVSCASNSRTSFLALRVQLLRFRQCGRKDGQCKIAFNARDEDVEWWVLHFKRNRDMARFQQGLEPESSCTVSV